MKAELASLQPARLPIVRNTVSAPQNASNQHQKEEENVVRKPLKKTRNSNRKFRRLSLTTLVMAIAIVAIAAITVVSRQKVRVNEANNPKRTTVMANATKNQGNFMTVKVAGQDVQVDPQTGKMKELTPEEAQKMAAGLKKMINQSSDGLVQVHHPDGTVSMDMEDRFQNVPVARVNKDGSISQSCVDNPKAAGEFFGINPKLIEKQP